MNKINVFFNEKLVFEYDRTIMLDDKQREFLDKMDLGMQRGIKIYGKLISEPDDKQRAIFVAMNLIKAVQQNDNARISLSCAYLGERLPHLIEVHAKDQEDRINIEFIETH